MKKIITLLLAGVLVGTIISCKEKKTTDDIIVSKIIKKPSSEPIKMENFSQTNNFRCCGEALTCIINRTPNDSSAMVKNEMDQTFVDNKVTLTIKRGDGSVFFEKTMTKSTFNSYIDDDYRKTGILGGLVYDRVEGQNIFFAASVIHPHTDELIPLIVKISSKGGMEISLDNQLDTSSNE